MAKFLTVLSLLLCGCLTTGPEVYRRCIEAGRPQRYCEGKRQEFEKRANKPNPYCTTIVHGYKVYTSCW